MVQVRDVTQALSQALSTGGGHDSGIDSIDHAMIDIERLPALLENPAAVLKAMGHPVTDESRVRVTTVGGLRPHAAALLRRVIVVIIAHFSNCDTIVVVGVFNRA